MKFDVQISYEAYKSTMGILNFYMNLVQNGVRLHSFYGQRIAPIKRANFKSLIR